MEEYMKDSAGRMVPIDMIRPVDVARDSLVRELVSQALVLEKQLGEFKRKAMVDVRAFVELSTEQYGVKIGGQKGNITLTSFDGEYKILIAMADQITFDERLQAAKVLIDECIKSWTIGARSEIKVLIDNAFAVDRQGKINTGRVLGLRRLEIKDPQWQRAMEAISDSVTITATKEYIRIYRRASNGEYVLVSLNAVG